MFICWSGGGGILSSSIQLGTAPFRNSFRNPAAMPCARKTLCNSVAAEEFSPKVVAAAGWLAGDKRYSVVSMGLAMLFARILPSTTEPGSGGSFVFCKHHPCPVLLLYRAKTGNYTKAAISKVTHDNFLWSRRPTTGTG